MATSHLVDDLYQGIVPAMMPFLVAEQHYNYAAVAGLSLAATVLSSVAQPVFGWLGDRRVRRWMIPAGILTAALGVGVAGLTTTYALTWVLIALSGLGIAAFHPEAARAARQASGDNNRAMSIFALGGNVGYAVGAAVATPVLLALGLHGTMLLIIPALLVAAILIIRLRTVLDGRVGAPRARSLPTGVDDWPAFLRLALVVVVRSILFLGVSSFIALYFIRELGTSTAIGSTALTVYLFAGACGTFAGGWLADRAGRLASIRLGFAITVPALIGLFLVTSWPLTMVFVALVGLGGSMPFSVFVVLGQDYLPNRIGTASGLTVGLGASVGGLFSPLLGLLADHTSLHVMLGTLVLLPVVALVVTVFMREARGSRVRLGR
jgi:FSR family fosmidomycin resistance protein-like MFS transporter